jgi:4-hydroxy-2-oxoheptanedioate aldolase
MIEDIKTVGRLEELTKAPGIDGFYIGPTDLALSMGLDPAVFRENPEHQKACQRVLDVAKKAGLAAGIHCWSTDEAVKRTQQGWMFCPAMNDVSVIASAGASAVKMIKAAK